MAKKLSQSKSLKQAIACQKDESGAALVELVLAIPIFIFIIVGMVEVGRMVYFHHALTDGSRAAARYLSRVEDPCAPNEISRAAGLVVTRSSDWSYPPFFNDWPDSFGAVGDNFQINVPECVGGALGGEALTVVSSYRLTSATGLIAIIGVFGPAWIVGLHQERHIGE